jgi:hypothetical protein
LEERQKVAKGDQTAPIEATTDDQVRQQLLLVMQQVVHNLEDSTTLGELVDATRSNPHLAPLLRQMSVHELVEMVGRKPAPTEEEPGFDEDGNPIGDLSGAAAVIRRRADVPDGDVRVLRCLADQPPMSEAALARAVRMTADQARLLFRHLRTKGFVHIEGSGTKRKIKITRNGGNWLRKRER